MKPVIFQFRNPLHADIAAIAEKYSVRMEGEPTPVDPAVPAPAPAAPAPAAAPAAVDTRSEIEKASDAARARINEGGSADPAVKKPTPRDDATGKFTDQPKRRLPEPKVEGDPAVEGEPEGGREGADSEKTEGDPKEPVAGAEAVEGDEGDEGGEDEPEFVEIDLPGRRDGETVKYAFAPEEAEDIQRLVNGYKRGEVVAAERAEIQEKINQIADWQEMVELDPASAVQRTLGDDPKEMSNLALQILADPKVWELVADRVLGWEDPQTFEVERVKLENAALKRRDEVREMAETRQAVSRNLSQVQAAVGSLIPSDKLSEDQATTFYRDALRDLKEHAERNGLLTLDPRDIPLILASSGRLKAYGINPVEAAEKVQEALAPRRAGSGTGTKPPGKPAAPAPAAPPAAPKSGKQFTENAQRRRVAAAAPAGAGSPSTAVTPPPGQSIEERTKWHRDQAAKGRTLTR